MLKNNRREISRTNQRWEFLFSKVTSVSKKIIANSLRYKHKYLSEIQIQITNHKSKSQIRETETELHNPNVRNIRGSFKKMGRLDVDKPYLPWGTLLWIKNNFETPADNMASTTVSLRQAA